MAGLIALVPTLASAHIERAAYWPDPGPDTSITPPAGVMGRRPDGTPDPNGTDYWWDQFLGNAGNCWYDNIGQDGTANSVTSEPPAPLLPSNRQLSVGTIGPVQEAELVGCLAAIEFDVEGCPWYATPPEPQP